MLRRWVKGPESDRRCLDLGSEDERFSDVPCERERLWAWRGGWPGPCTSSWNRVWVLGERV
ncbi:hypothetical protein AG1IA_08804 [Rhizoctonia solani AG-1 IA]|uniref:Uncharacterized protein n=1 Tax=Thanatephorus cucumeris (strain AG1-IA) TaxID=983506 RepID=L8WGV9_THACA|nr:hypothetical protein AG1IA_08804 [Rhizoctonia solani AG-1 IA]